MLSPELHQDKIPDIFQRFSEAIDEMNWINRATVVRAEIESKPHLREVLLEQNRVVLTLEECSQAAARHGGRLPWLLTSENRLIEAFVFAWQAVQLLDAARTINNKRARILASRLIEAIREPRMLQAMQLEAQVAIHFIVAGRRVVFPELGSGRENFDLLVEDIGPKGLEIECKFVTHDKGRKIHRIEARDCLDRLQATEGIQLAARKHGRGLGMRITVPGKLPAKELLDDFCRGVSDVLISGKSGELSDGTRVQMVDFSPSVLGPLTRPVSSQTLEAVNQILGKHNAHSMIFAANGAKHGVVVVILESAQPDSMLHELFSTYCESAGRQLTGTRPGALFSIFEGLGSDQLASITKDEGKNGNYSALAWKASAFLQRSEYPHVVGVGFLSEPDYSTHETAASGLAYWIPKPISPMWSNDFSGLFGRDPRKAVAQIPG